MTICHNRMPKSADLQMLNNDYPVVQVRLRVRWNEVSEFLKLYNTYFVPVDRLTREVLFFLHEYRAHFNLTFLYRYRRWDDLHNFTRIFSRAWAVVHRLTDVDDPVGQIEAREAEMNSMIEDEERLLLIEFKNNNWFSPRIEAR